MLEIFIPKFHKLFFSEQTEEFFEVDFDDTVIQLEHSLVSLRKWEQKWHKPFLAEEEKTYEEIIDYIRCMTLNDVKDPNIYNWLEKETIEEILKYIEDPMTATWFSEKKTKGAQKSSKEIVTAEIIYYWMIALSIPVEFQNWHLNQLLTLIKVVNIKNGKEEKTDPKEAAKLRAKLNKERRAKYKSKG